MRSPTGVGGNHDAVRGAALLTIQGGRALAGPTLSVGDLLVPGSIAPRISATGKRQVIAVIAEMAGRGLGVKAAVVFEALMARESAGSTGIGYGVAIPHARVAGLANLRAFFVRLAAPVDFQAVDDQPVDLIFALLAPLDPGSEHLRALARVARMLRERDLRQQLRAAPSVAAIRALLVREARPSAA
ncbi:MAG TPA: PTS sugar transporter subunit IIA [Caulobacteraceae bacterium]